MKGSKVDQIMRIATVAKIVLVVFSMLGLSSARVLNVRPSFLAHHARSSQNLLPSAKTQAFKEASVLIGMSLSSEVAEILESIDPLQKQQDALKVVHSVASLPTPLSVRVTLKLNLMDPWSARGDSIRSSRSRLLTLCHSLNSPPAAV